MLRAALLRHPLQKRMVIQWDIGVVLGADGAADESVSPQSGIIRLLIPGSNKSLVDYTRISNLHPRPEKCLPGGAEP